LVGSLLDGEVEISTLGDFPKVARYHEFKEVKGEGGRAVRDNLQGIQGRRKAWTRTF
jgi:hypothetical protein